MFSWLKKTLSSSPPLPDLADWQRTCPDCEVPDGHLHELFCAKERCPFCQTQLAGCDCIYDILQLSLDERKVREEYVDDSVEPLRTIMERWSEVLEAKGRVPYHSFPLPCSADGMILAAAKGVLPFVKTLLAKGVAVDAVNEVGQTALMAAAWNYRVDVVRHLLSQGANVRLRNQHGHSPLHCAVMMPTSGLNEAMLMQAQCVRMLLIQHPDVNAVDQSGGTPLMSAAWFGCAPSVDLLLKAGAEVGLKDERGRTAQQLAAERGHTAIAQLLAKRGA